jgi:hypothetical protein
MVLNATFNNISATPCRLGVIYFVSRLRQVAGFLRVLWFPPATSKPNRHGVAEILLKVALSTINLRFELTTLVVIVTDCTDICMSYFSKSFVGMFFTKLFSEWVLCSIFPIVVAIFSCWIELIPSNTLPITRQLKHPLQSRFLFRSEIQYGCYRMTYC